MWGEELDPLPTSHDLLLFGTEDLLLEGQIFVFHCSKETWVSTRREKDPHDRVAPTVLH